jgi:hypothetical protein
MEMWAVVALAEAVAGVGGLEVIVFRLENQGDVIGMSFQEQTFAVLSLMGR